MNRNKIGKKYPKIIDLISVSLSLLLISKTLNKGIGRVWIMVMINKYYFH